MYRFISTFSCWLCLLLLALPAQADATLTMLPLRASQCSGGFVAHDLDHKTVVNSQPVRMFDSNGAGVAINDLDNDGALDVVLVNLDAPHTILWNTGDGHFTTQTFNSPGRSRGVTIVDVDGDGWQDIVLTTQLGAPVWWRGLGERQFVRTLLPGVRYPAYALNWDDVDGDGDLDLVTGSYDAELAMILRDTFLFGDGAGVYFYENRAGVFVPTRLAEAAQALAVLFFDWNGDGRRDIAVGNDFGVPDGYWTQTADGWRADAPFAETTFSTMSFDAGDIDNDGVDEFFAADMQPYSGENFSAWQPVLQQLRRQRLPEGDPQIIENTLQQATPDGYINIARTLGVDATGWSWSSRFGDLDSDGWLDIYVVNGMIAVELFESQPGAELVEQNQALRNLEGVRFQPVPEWGLGSERSGRGMSMADMDGDGDLDIVVNNLNTPAQYFENQLCGGDNLIVRLRRQDVPNRYAIGARVHLTVGDSVYVRELRAASGYLSGSAAEVHFGFPFGSEPLSLSIDWGDGIITPALAVERNMQVTITR
jgi:hypothetical protein